MLVDALTENPLVVTGSGNFSVASIDKASIAFNNTFALTHVAVSLY